jgi:glycosyltransferase involved in cell wall biosynthesis
MPEMTCGVAEYTARLAEALSGAGVDITVLTSVDDAVAPSASYRIVQRTRRWGIRQLPAILRGVRAGRPDLVHLQYPSTGYRHGFAPGLLLPILRVLSPRTRLVATVHEYRHMHPLHRLYAAATMPWAHAIVCPDRSQLAGMPSIGRRAVVEIPLTSNLAATPVRSRPVTTDGELVVGTWGLWREDKGIDIAIDAFERVAARRPSRFVLAGDRGHDLAYISFIEDRIASSPYRGRISWTGRLSADELLAVLLTFDACVLPYRAGLEKNRGTYATAVASGVYTVTTSAGQTGYVADGNTTFVALGDVDVIVDAILQASDHPARPPRDTGPSWTAIAARHVEVYSSLTRRER